MRNTNKKFWLSDDENIGAAIRKLREDQGLKAYELAKKVGIDRTYITKIEKHNKLPSFFVMKQISDLLRNPELLEVYIKMKCSPFYKGTGEGKDALEYGLERAIRQGKKPGRPVGKKDSKIRNKAGYFYRYLRTK